jgi:putative transposase
MPAGLKRYYGKGHLHFITFSCYRRLPLLNSQRARNIFVQELARVRDEMGFHLIGYVVMPEHVHLLLSEPRQGTPSAVLQKLKQRVARRLRKRRRVSSAAQLRLPFEDRGEPLRSFWQARFYDFNVYSRGKEKEKLNYMHANPLIRKLVKHPKDWPWSSWSFYGRGEAGLICIDVKNEKQQATPRPRLTTRPWGTLRLSLLLQNVSKCYPRVHSHVGTFSSP